MVLDAEEVPPDLQYRGKSFVVETRIRSTPIWSERSLNGTERHLMPNSFEHFIYDKGGLNSPLWSLNDSYDSAFLQDMFSWDLQKGGGAQVGALIIGRYFRPVAIYAYGE